MNADPRNLPVLLKGGAGVLLSAGLQVATLIAQAGPVIQFIAGVVGVLVGILTGVNVCYGIIIRHRKLQLLKAGKDVTE